MKKMLRKHLSVLLIAGSLGSALVAAQHDSRTIIVIDSYTIESNEEYAQKVAEAKEVVAAVVQQFENFKEMKASFSNPQFEDELQKLMAERIAGYEADFKAIIDKSLPEDLKNSLEMCDLLMGEESQGKELINQLYSEKMSPELANGAYKVVFEQMLPKLMGFFKEVALSNEQLENLENDLASGSKTEAEAAALIEKSNKERKKLARMCELMEKNVNRVKETLPDVYALYVKMFPEIFQPSNYDLFEEAALRTQKSLLIVAQDLLKQSEELAFFDAEILC